MTGGAVRPVRTALSQPKTPENRATGATPPHSLNAHL